MFALTPFRRRSLGCEYDPFREFENLERRFFGSAGMPDFRIDICEKEDCYLLEADLPGFSKSDINIEIEPPYLTIKAVRSPKEAEREDGRYIHSERFFGGFERTFDIAGVDTEGISATYEDGVLCLVMPKKKMETSKKISLPIE